MRQLCDCLVDADDVFALQDLKVIHLCAGRKQLEPIAGVAPIFQQSSKL